MKELGLIFHLATQYIPWQHLQKKKSKAIIIMCSLFIWQIKIFALLDTETAQVSFRLPLRNCCVIDDHGYVPFVIGKNQSFSRLWLIINMTNHRIFSMKDKTCAASGEETAYLLLLTPAFKSAFFLFFVWICLLTVSFEHCIIWPSIYGFWYPLRYL